MEIAYHIGANCTDDDRLLKSLLKNAQTFGDLGVKVPGPGKYRRIIRETIQGLNGAAPSPETRSIILDEVLDGERPSRLVMCNPNFICIPNRIFDNGVFYQQAEQKVRSLVQIFPNDEIELFLGIRNPATFLPEAFAASKAETLEAYLMGVFPTEIRWSDIVKRLVHVAPNAQLTVWCNEDTPFIWEELIRDLAGVAEDTKIAGSYDLLSTIMTDDGMRRFQAYLQKNPPQTPDQRRKIISAFLGKYAIEEEIEDEIDLPGMTAHLIHDLTVQYEKDIELIAGMEAVHFVKA